MITQFYSEENISVAYNMNWKSHHFNHKNSTVTIQPKQTYGINDNNITVKQVSNEYARLINQYKVDFKQSFKQALISRMNLIKY